MQDAAWQTLQPPDTRRDGKVYLSPRIKFGKYAWKGSGLVLVVDEADRNLGGQVFASLLKSMHGVTAPVYKHEHDVPLLKAAGFRSYESFYDSTKMVSIDWDHGGLTLVPSRNGGPGNRFLYLKKRINCRAVETDAGNALRAAFDACEW